MRPLFQMVVAGLVAVALLLAPNAGASAARRHDSATPIHMTGKDVGAAGETRCGFHSTPGPRSAENDAGCVAFCALPAFVTGSTQIAVRSLEPIRRVASVDAFAVSLTIPPPLGPPRS